MSSFIADEPIIKPKAEVAPLYRLPNGSWITLADVREIEVVPVCKSYDGQHDQPPRVLVLTGSLDHLRYHWWECGTIEEAHEFRDRIAADRNVG